MIKFMMIVYIIPIMIFFDKTDGAVGTVCLQLM